MALRAERGPVETLRDAVDSRDVGLCDAKRRCGNLHVERRVADYARVGELTMWRDAVCAGCTRDVRDVNQRRSVNSDY